MVSAVQTSVALNSPTTTTHVLKLRSPAAQSATPVASSSSRLAGPIKLTGEFEKRGIKHYDVTPAIGTEFPDGAIDLGEILSRDDEENEALLRELASLVSHRGVVFLRNQKNLTAEQMTLLADKLGELSGRPKDSKLHIHPLTADFSESGEYIGKGEKIDSEPDAQGRQISFPDEKSNFASAGWHTDISFEPVPSDYAMLRLTTIPPVGGDTMWASMYSAYDALSPAMQRFLEGLTATHDAEMFRTQSQRYGFDLYSKPRGHPENVGTHLRTVHPVIRTNPVTGWKGLYVNKSFTRRINELSIDESDALLAYLFRHIAENFNFHVRFRWSKNDLCVWDNRTTNHSGTFDFGNQKRTGDRCCSLGEKPYLDPNSRSRKEELGI